MGNAITSQLEYLIVYNTPLDGAGNVWHGTDANGTKSVQEFWTKCTQGTPWRTFNFTIVPVKPLTLSPAVELLSSLAPLAPSLWCTTLTPLALDVVW